VYYILTYKSKEKKRTIRGILPVIIRKIGKKIGKSWKYWENYVGKKEVMA
jgi:hypothetical protein